VGGGKRSDQPPAHDSQIMTTTAGYRRALLLVFACVILPCISAACASPGGTGASADAPSRLGESAAGAAPATAPVIPGAIVQRWLVGAVSMPEIDRASRRLYVYGSALPAQYEVDWYQIGFTTTDGQGKTISVPAQLLVPRMQEPAELPVYVFGPGTTGIGGGCAPSHEQALGRDWGDFEAHLLSYAAQGYITVMPDYAGFDDPVRHQYYYVAEMHAHVLLDAARAALRFFESRERPSAARVANAVFFAGYSQGGHAAFAARDVAGRYAPELMVKGSIAYGGRGDVATLFTEFPSLGPYLIYAYAQYYGTDKVNVERLLQSRWLPTLEEDVTTKCIDEVPAYYGDDPRRIYRPEFLNALNSGQLAQTYPELEALLDRNSAGVGGKNIPVLFLQGLADTAVTPQTSRAYMDRVCAAGGRATYLTYRDIPHVLTRQVSYRDTLEWMTTVLRGEPLRVDCHV
jgi:hypothetical protein